MRAVEIRAFGLDQLQLTDRPEPVPGTGEVVVRVGAVSLNYRDLLICKGLYDPRLKLPRVPCSDGAGQVVAIGPSVTSRKVGDRVCGCFFPNWLDGEISSAKVRPALGGDIDGMLAEFVCLPESAVVATPTHLTDEQAATLPCAALTAWNALAEFGGTQPGETLLLQGTGGVSIFALQLAKLFGARAIITSRSDEKLARAAELGAAAGINYQSTPDWDKRVRELTGGAGVDHVIEVGGAGTLNRSLKAVRTGGRVSLIGVLAGTSGPVDTIAVLMRALRLRGIFVGSRAMFEAMNRAISQHSLTPVVDRVFELAEVRAALEYLESAAHFGKVVIRLAR